MWAWKWDIEDDNFGAHLGVPPGGLWVCHCSRRFPRPGIPLHPSHAKLSLPLDEFAANLPHELTTFALLPPHIIPCRIPRYPPALIRHVLARIPPPITPVPNNKPTNSSSAAMNSPTDGQVGVGQGATSADIKPPPVHTESGFVFPLPPMPNMPAMPNMNFSLDMKNMRWGWPDYLTFGKGGGAPERLPNPPLPPAARAGLLAVVEGQGDPLEESPSGESPHPDVDVHRKSTLDVDTASLLEAISTESIGSYTRTPSPAPSVLSKSSQLGEFSTETSVSTGGNVSPVDDTDPLEMQVNGIPQIVYELPGPELPPLQIVSRPVRSFLWSRVYLESSDDPCVIERYRVLHLTVRGT